jgi:hypothetical protein
MTPVNEGGRLTVQDCRRAIDKWWGGRLADNIRIIKGIKGSAGALFDIYED